MLCMTSLSKHFILIGVSAMGQQLFSQDTGDFFGTGMIVVDLRHVGMTAWLSEVLKISVRTSVSCSAQSFSTWRGMLSGPAALRGLILDRVFLTLVGDRQSGAPGHWEVWAVFVRVCHSAFQTVNKSG